MIGEPSGSKSIMPIVVSQSARGGATRAQAAGIKIIDAAMIPAASVAKLIFIVPSYHRSFWDILCPQYTDIEVLLFAGDDTQPKASRYCVKRFTPDRQTWLLGRSTWVRYKATCVG